MEIPKRGLGQLRRHMDRPEQGQKVDTKLSPEQVKSLQKYYVGLFSEFLRLQIIQTLKNPREVDATEEMIRHLTEYQEGER